MMNSAYASIARLDESIRDTQVAILEHQSELVTARRSLALEPANSKLQLPVWFYQKELRQLQAHMELLMEKRSPRARTPDMHLEQSLL